MNDLSIILTILSQVLSTATEYTILAKRVAAGEEITQEEMDAARQKTKDAVKAWDDAVPL